MTVELGTLWRIRTPEWIAELAVVLFGPQTFHFLDKWNLKAMLYQNAQNMQGPSKPSVSEVFARFSPQTLEAGSSMTQEPFTRKTDHCQLWFFFLKCFKCLRTLKIFGFCEMRCCEATEQSAKDTCLFPGFVPTDLPWGRPLPSELPAALSVTASGRGRRERSFPPPPRGLAHTAVTKVCKNADHEKVFKGVSKLSFTLKGYPRHFTRVRTQ